MVCACASLRPVYVGMDAASGGIKYSWSEMMDVKMPKKSCSVGSLLKKRMLSTMVNSMDMAVAYTLDASRERNGKGSCDGAWRQIASVWGSGGMATNAKEGRKEGRGGPFLHRAERVASASKCHRSIDRLLARLVDSL